MPEDIQNGQELVEQKPLEEVTTSKQTQETESELPEDASDRTREQFEKLKAHNKELSDRLKALEVQKQQPGSIFESLTPNLPDVTKPLVNLPQIPGLPTNQVNDIYEGLVDKDGYIDQSLLTKALREAQETAKQAALEAKRAREELDKRTETEQVRYAHKEFPILDPKSPKFDQKFFNAVRNEMVSQMINGEKDLVAAAKKVAEWYPMPKDDSEKKQEQVKQANLTGMNPSRPASKPSDPSDLVRRTQRGDTSALMERLQRSGF